MHTQRAESNCLGHTKAMWDIMALEFIAQGMATGWELDYHPLGEVEQMQMELRAVPVAGIKVFVMHIL